MVSDKLPVEYKVRHHGTEGSCEQEREVTKVRTIYRSIHAFLRAGLVHDCQKRQVQFSTEATEPWCARRERSYSHFVGNEHHVLENERFAGYASPRSYYMIHWNRKKELRTYFASARAFLFS